MVKKGKFKKMAVPKKKRKSKVNISAVNENLTNSDVNFKEKIIKRKADVSAIRRKVKKKKEAKNQSFSQEVKKDDNQEWIPSEGEEEIFKSPSHLNMDDDDDEEYNPSELEQELSNLEDAEDKPRRTYNIKELTEEEELERSLRRRSNARGTPKSDYLGVSFCNRKKLWHGRIWLKKEKRLVWIGYYEDQIECARAVNEACIKHNIPIKNPNI